MSQRQFVTREVGRRQTDPSSSSSRFNTNRKYQRRGGNDLESITVSIHRNLSTGGPQRRRFEPQPIRSTQQTSPDEKWWRVSIPQAGSIGKDRVMSTLKANCLRQFQPFHLICPVDNYFIDRDTNMGVFFVNSRDEADMLRRANRKVEVQNSGTLSIMVSQASCPAPILDEDSRRFFSDFIRNHRFNPQTFQLDLSNLTQDEELRSLGIYPQLNKVAFMRDLVTILNGEFPSTRQLDFGSNKISNLNEFRKLCLNDLEQLSFASNDLKNVEELNHLKQLPRLFHLVLKNNPLTSMNNRKVGSQDDLISAVRQRLPQLKRLDEFELPAEIGFGIDKETVNLPRSLPFCVPSALQDFLSKFIDEFYRLFDSNGRDSLHACYHDSSIFSICISPNDHSAVPTKQWKFGALLHESRNFKKIFDENKRSKLLLRGKSSLLDFFRVKFPSTKHDGASFHVDVVSTFNQRAVFNIVGLFRELDQRPTGTLRTFQRTFTCVETPTGVLIIADHLTIGNVSEVQFQVATRVAPPPTTTTTTTTTSENEMVLRFSKESLMNQNFSRQCLAENNWDYQKAAARFLELKNKNLIPPEAFR